MTSMTTAGGVIAPAPQWRLGELGQMLQEHMEHKIESLDELTLYMQRNEADLLYGSRVLAQIEAILKDVRRNGLSRDLAVAVESARPGTIPKNVQKILTSNYTRTGQHETVVALESWQAAGKVGLVLLLCTAIMKILSWIFENGRGYKGKTDEGDPEGYAADVEGKMTTADEVKLPEKDFGFLKDSVKSATVKDAYLKATAGSDSTINAALMVSAARLDKLIQETKTDKFLNTLASKIGTSPFTKLFKSYVSDKKVASNAILADAIDAILSYHVTDAVYTHKAAMKAQKELPKTVVDAGVRIPNDMIFKVMSLRLPELKNFFMGVGSGFKTLADPKLIEEFERNPDAIVMEEVAVKFGNAIAALNEFIAVSVNDVTRSKNINEQLPTVAIKSGDERDLIGYDEPLEFVWNRILITAQYGSYFNGTFMTAYRDKHAISDADARAIFSAIAELEGGTSGDTYVTNLSAYEDLRKACSGMMDEIQDWSKANRTAKGDYIDALSKKIIANALAENRSRVELNRELTFSYRDEPDFLAMLRKNLSWVRKICYGAVGLQQIINYAGNNPLLKTK